MSEISNSLLSLLFDWSIRYGVLILGLALWIWLRPPRSIATRLLLGWLVLVGGMLLPLTPRWLSVSWPVSVDSNALSPKRIESDSIAHLDEESSSQARPFRDVNSRLLLPALSESKSSDFLDNHEALPPAPVDALITRQPPAPGTTQVEWGLLVVVVWAVGVTFCLARLLIGYLRITQIKRNATKPLPALADEWNRIHQESGARRRATLMVSEDVCTPSLLGGMNPVLAVPPDWMHADESSRRMVLLHEASHVAHWDDWARIFEELVRSIFFFHPLVHWLINRIGCDREQRCDAAAIRKGAIPRQFARLLLTELKKVGGRPAAPLPSLSFFPNTSARECIEKLLEANMNGWIQPISAWRAATVALIVLAIACTLGGLRPVLAMTSTSEPIPEEKDTVLVKGSVLLADGTGANGATVWAVKSHWGPVIRRETTSGAKGQFQLSLPQGHWFFHASKEGQGGTAKSPAWNRWEISPTKKIGEIDIQMENRGWFTGRALEAETGKPLANARVYFANGTIATTGADGIWKTGGLEPICQGAVVVARGHKRQDFLFEPSTQKDVPLEIRLPMGSTIRGTVTDLEGRPIPQAWVGRWSGLIYSMFESCNQDGSFEVDSFSPIDQRTRLNAGAPGFAEAEIHDILIESGKAATVHFRLKRLAKKDSTETVSSEQKERVISGIVLGRDQRPVPDVFLRWGLGHGFGAITTTTDATGKFTMIVPEDEQRLCVIPGDQAPQFPLIARNGNQEIKVILEKGFSASGTVLDDQGKPLEGVRVRPIFPHPKDEPGRTHYVNEKTVFTDKAGKFTIKGLPEEIHFEFSKTGYSEAKYQTLTLNAPKNETRLAHSGSIKGKVVDSQGKPVRNFRITLNSSRDAKPTDGWGGYHTEYCHGGVHFTSVDGTFALTGLESGAIVRVKAYADGYGEAVQDRVLIVPDKRLNQSAGIVLTAEPPTPLKIHVTDHQGKALTDARVTLIDGELQLDQGISWGYNNATSGDIVRGKTNAQGVADFPKLSFKGATVLIEAAGHARQRLAWRKGEKEIQVKMAKEAILAGHLAWDPKAEGKVFVGRLSTRQGDTIHLVEISHANNGRFQVKELPAGIWTLSVEGSEGSVTDVGAVELNEGETTERSWDWNP